jgi:hypothetical protein
MRSPTRDGEGATLAPNRAPLRSFSAGRIRICRAVDPLSALYGPFSYTLYKHRRLRRWQQEVIWQCIHRTLLGLLERMKRIDWSSGLLDGSFVPAKRGRCGRPDRQGEE